MKKEDKDEICDALKYLYTAVMDKEYDEWEKKFDELQKSFIDNILSFHKENDINSAVLGIFTGILLKKEEITMEDAMRKFNSFLTGTENSKKMSASFLKGYFNVAKDTVFVDDRLLTSLDNILKETSSDLFLQILPDLRFAFTYFLPFEIDKISKKVSSFYNVTRQDLQYKKSFNPKEIEKAIEWDKYCGEMPEERF